MSTLTNPTWEQLKKTVEELINSSLGDYNWDEMTYETFKAENRKSESFGACEELGTPACKLNYNWLIESNELEASVKFEGFENNTLVVTFNPNEKTVKLAG